MTSADLIDFEENIRMIRVSNTVLLTGEFQKVKATKRLKAAYREHASPTRNAVVSEVNASTPSFSDRIETVKAGRENPFIVKKRCSHFNKGNYACYRDLEENGAINAQRSAAYKEVLTDEDRLTLFFVNQALETVSSWSGDVDVRNIVHELDLDPFISRFNTTVYYKETTQFVPREQLRVGVITQLNNRRVILDIHDGSLNKLGRESYPDLNEPVTHFFITTAQRRKLPAIA